MGRVALRQHPGQSRPTLLVCRLSVRIFPHALSSVIDLCSPMLQLPHNCHTSLAQGR